MKVSRRTFLGLTSALAILGITGCQERFEKVTDEEKKSGKRGSGDQHLVGIIVVENVYSMPMFEMGLWKS